MRYRYWIAFGSSILLALIFLVAGLGKLLGQSAFLLEISSWIISPRIAHLIATLLPWTELVLGTCLIIGIAPRFMACLSAIPVLSFISHNGWMISQGLGYEPCSCLGIFEQFFLGDISTVDALIIDIVLIVLALLIYFLYPYRFFSIRPWFYQRKEPVES